MSLVGGEDRRVGVCCSNCGHWKTIIGYMETSHAVAKCSNVYIFLTVNKTYPNVVCNGKP